MTTRLWKRGSQSLLALTMLWTIGCQGRGDPVPPDVVAIRYLHELVLVEEQVRSQTSHYGLINEITPMLEARLSARFLRRVRESHSIRFAVTPQGYCVFALPLAGSYARRSFFVDQTGLIRQEWDGRKVTSQSPALR